MDWFEAQNWCERKGMLLATLTLEVLNNLKSPNLGKNDIIPSSANFHFNF